MLYVLLDDAKVTSCRWVKHRSGERKGSFLCTELRIELEDVSVPRIIPRHHLQFVVIAACLCIVLRFSILTKDKPTQMIIER